ncbi:MULTISPECIES: hypothetical protein [unclassified Thiocapsa]
MGTLRFAQPTTDGVHASVQVVSEPSFGIRGTGNPQRADTNPISEVNRKT